MAGGPGATAPAGASRRPAIPRPRQNPRGTVRRRELRRFRPATRPAGTQAAPPHRGLPDMESPDGAKCACAGELAAAAAAAGALMTCPENTGNETYGSRGGSETVAARRAGAGARGGAGWGAPAQGDPPSARALPQHGGRRARDPHGLEFQVGPGTAPRRPVPPRSCGGPPGGPGRGHPGPAEGPLDARGARSGPRLTVRRHPPPLPAAPAAWGLTLTARFAVMACEHFREPCCSWRQALYLYYYYCSNLDTVFKFYKSCQDAGEFLYPLHRVSSNVGVFLWPWAQ